MRALAVCLSMLAMMKVCGAEPAPAPVVPPVGAAPTFMLTAQHGGTVVRADDHWVEVVPRADGTVEAYVVGPTGAPPVPQTTVVTARVPASDRRSHDVALAWSPEHGRYEGRLRGARPAAGPVEVVVIAGGVPRRATAPHVIVVEAAPSVVVEAPRRGRDRTVVVTEPARPEVVVVHEPVRPGVVVVAPDPRPGVVVVAPDPRPGVVVVAPPRPHVVVAPPAPGVVIIDDHHHHDRGRHLGHYGGGGHGHGGGHGRGRH